MNSLTFLHNINSNINSAIISVLNLVLFLELTIACCRGMYRGWTIGEATVGKIFLLTMIAAIMFRLWQSWPHEFVVLALLLGENRSTQDLDLVIDLEAQTAQRLIDAMSGEFYISESAVTEAIAKSRTAPRESSFNVIYLPSMEKADIFVMGSDDPFSASVMSRRQLHPVSGLQEEGIYIYSPEDIVLQKLSWHKLIPGGSQKQWRDVLGVLKVQGERLDLAYLNQWAVTLKLTDWLSGALLQSGY